MLVADTGTADDAPTDMGPCEKAEPWIGTAGGDAAPGSRRGAGLLLGGVPAAAATLSQGADDALLDRQLHISLKAFLLNVFHKVKLYPSETQQSS